MSTADWRGRVIGLFLVLGMIVAADTVVIRGGPSCPSCRMVAEVVAVLGGDDSTVVDLRHLSVARVKGQYLATGMGPPGAIAVFDSKGTLQRQLGRRGAGPGEYQQPMRLRRWRGDSTLVLDRDLNRLTVLTPDLSYARSFVLRTRAARLIGLPSGEIAFTGGSGADSAVRLSTSDGTRQMGVPGFNDGIRQREITVTRAGQLWTARGDRYELERRDGRGHVVSIVRRVVGWYPAKRPRVDLAKEPGPPGMSVLAADEQGRLWVAIAVTQEPFDPPVVTGPDGRQQLDLELWYARKDTVIEVIDPVLGTVVATGRLTGVLSMDEFPFGYTIRTDAEGLQSVEVVRLRLASGR